MKAKFTQKTKTFLRLILLFLPLLLLTFCDTTENDITENIVLETDSMITKDAKAISLMKSTVIGEGDQQCGEFEYPIAFYVIFTGSQNIEIILVNSDEELFSFFDTLTAVDQIRIDFPLVLIGTNGARTTINDIVQLEEVLQVFVDNCRENTGGQGLRFGHFDVDTAHLVYAFNEGKTDAHTHEYDDKFETNIVDYFNIETGDKTGSKALHNINDTDYGVPNDNEQFYLIVANANLSQDVQVNINGTLISVMDYQAKVDAYMNGDNNALEAYTLGNSQGATKLTSLEFVVGLDAALSDNGLIPTETSTVRSNTPGPNGEYRDGALIIQAINVNDMSLNADLRVADSDAGLFWESTIFWHFKN